MDPKTLPTDRKDQGFGSAAAKGFCASAPPGVPAASPAAPNCKRTARRENAWLMTISREVGSMLVNTKRGTRRLVSKPSTLPVPQGLDIGEKLAAPEVVDWRFTPFLPPPAWRALRVAVISRRSSCWYKFYEAFEVLGGGCEEGFFFGS